MCLIPLAAAQDGGADGADDASADGSAASGAQSEAPDRSETQPADRIDERELTFGEAGDGDAGGEDAAPGSINSFGVWDFVRMVVVLGIVIAAIYLVFYLLKRASGGRLENSPMIRVLGSHALPGNKALHLVEVGRQVFLVGVGDDSVTYLSEISDQESLDELRLKASTSSGERRGNFADMLSGLFQGGGSGDGATGSGGGSANDGRGGSGRRADSSRGEAGREARSDNASAFFESQKERLRRLR